MLSVRQKDFSLEIKIFLSTFSFPHYHEIGVKVGLQVLLNRQQTDSMSAGGKKVGKMKQGNPRGLFENRPDVSGNSSGRLYEKPAGILEKGRGLFALFFTWSF